MLKSQKKFEPHCKILVKYNIFRILKWNFFLNPYSVIQTLQWPLSTGLSIEAGGSPGFKNYMPHSHNWIGSSDLRLNPRTSVRFYLFVHQRMRDV